MNSKMYVGDWGVRVEDTNVVGKDGPITLTSYPRVLARALPRRKNVKGPLTTVKRQPKKSGR